MPWIRHRRWIGGTLFGLLSLLIGGAALAEDLSVVIGYETRAVGEIDPCG